jgi:transposase
MTRARHSPVSAGRRPRRSRKVERLRRQRMSSPAIARRLAMPISTVTGILRRLGLNRLKALEPPPRTARDHRPVFLDKLDPGCLQ